MIKITVDEAYAFDYYSILHLKYDNGYLPLETLQIAKNDLTENLGLELVETILKNLKGRKRHLHALSVLVEQEQTIYDITVDREEFITTLNQNLPVLEENEDYETCADIIKAINFLKGTKK